MSRERLVKAVKKFVEVRYKVFSTRYGQNVIDIFDFPIKLVLSPFTLAFDIAGSAPRGFGVPELISKLSLSSVFAIAALGTYDIAFELGKKVICQRNCRTCNGWQALRCTMCRGSGRVHYQVKNCTLKRGEKATAESVADAIVDNRAELVHIPSSLDFQQPLPSKSAQLVMERYELIPWQLGMGIKLSTLYGVMGCPECKHKLQVRISADDIMEPPWQAYNVMKKMDYPYEHERSQYCCILADYLPQIMGGFTYDDDVKQKIWLQYKESMRYDQLREVVAKRKPGWEYLQDALISIDPVRARDDPVVVKNIPYYKAKKALETEVMKLDPPPRPSNWGELDLPLSASSWSEEDLKDPEKFYEMTILLNAQRESLIRYWMHSGRLNGVRKRDIEDGGGSSFENKGSTTIC
ncbi:hypothetical protein SESBI_27287 [Sesbania bispinosa]|nr:hypothetical protein SESBI_27287 [Sesbania bispinosa]